MTFCTRIFNLSLQVLLFKVPLFSLFKVLFPYLTVAGEFLVAIPITTTCLIILLAFGDECYDSLHLAVLF